MEELIGGGVSCTFTKGVGLRSTLGRNAVRTVSRLRAYAVERGSDDCAVQFLGALWVGECQMDDVRFRVM